MIVSQQYLEECGILFGYKRVSKSYQKDLILNTLNGISVLKDSFRDTLFKNFTADMNITVKFNKHNEFIVVLAIGKLAQNQLDFGYFTDFLSQLRALMLSTASNGDVATYNLTEKDIDDSIITSEKRMSKEEWAYSFQNVTQRAFGLNSCSINEEV
jgi:hypothetical protein